VITESKQAFRLRRLLHSKKNTQSVNSAVVQGRGCLHAIAPKPWRGEGAYGKKMEADQTVEVRYGGQTQWFAGKINGPQALDGSYAVKYDDGDEEQGVPIFRIRTPQQKQHKKLQPYQQVDAAFDEGGLLFEGRVVNQRDDGKYFIEFADGDMACVERNRIFAACD